MPWIPCRAPSACAGNGAVLACARMVETGRAHRPASRPIVSRHWRRQASPSAGRHHLWSAARYFCETCPAGRFKQQAAQKASCVDCAFPSTNFGGGEVCDACVSGYVNTVDNGTAVCRECPRGFLCHEGSTRRNVTLRRGFWRSNYDLEATKCRKRNCDGGIGKGDALCRDGSTGPACDVCIKGRAPSRRGTCKVCDDANAAVVCITLVVVVTIDWPSSCAGF